MSTIKFLARKRTVYFHVGKKRLRCKTYGMFQCDLLNSEAILVAVLSDRVGLNPFNCWDRRFEYC